MLYNRSGAPCGESGVAVAVWQQRQVAAAGRSRPGVINQGVARVRSRGCADLAFSVTLPTGSSRSWHCHWYRCQCGTAFSGREE